MGAFSVEVSKRFGCRVHAVEPVDHLNQLIRQASSNGMVQVHCMAVSSTSGWSCFYVSPNSEASSLNQRTETDGKVQRVDVRTITLEDFLLSEQLESIDLLKMDIEGAELDVLELTSDCTLQRIKQLTVEFHEFLYPETSSRIKLVKQRLRRLGFWDLDFSQTNGDVLFINPILQCGVLERASAVWGKYSSGLARRLRRMTS